MAHLFPKRLFVKAIHSNILYIKRNSCMKTRELVFDKFGDPLCALKMVERSVPLIGAKDVLVRMLAAPINSPDVSVIAGKFPELPCLPCVAGTEGVGVVEQIGKEVITVAKGDRVIFTGPVQGTWRTIAVYPEATVTRIPDELGLAESATLMVNLCSAYRLLTDYKPMRQKKLAVIQNGPNGLCGLNVIRLCRLWEIPNINIVKKRADVDDMKAQLLALGATHVLTEEELGHTKIFKKRAVARPSLALNCVGGKNCTRMISQLNKSGVTVTYGGMSKPHIAIPTGPTIFKRLVYKGFRAAAWNADPNNKRAMDCMLSELIRLMCEKKLTTPNYKLIPFENYKVALQNTLHPKGFIRDTYILDFQNK